MAQVRLARRDRRADGLKVASDGSVWVADAHGGRVAVFNADGTHRQDIAVPLPMVTSLCFGGDDLRDLYIVTGSRGGPHENCGSIFHTRVDVAGPALPPAKVKGLREATLPSSPASRSRPGAGDLLGRWLPSITTSRSTPISA